MSLKKNAMESIVIAGSLVAMAGMAQNVDIAPTETGTVAMETESLLAENGRAGIVTALNTVEERAYNSLVDASANVEQENVTLVGGAETPWAGVTGALAAAQGGLSGYNNEEVTMESALAGEVSETETLPAEDAAAVPELVAAAEVTEPEIIGDVAAAEPETETEAEPETETEPEETIPVMSEEELAWQNCLMADVNEFLYVRAEGNEDAAIIGKLYKGDLAEVVEYGEEWTHVVSGNVDGYVKNSYCLFGGDAYAYATATFDMEAEVQTDGLRVRREASEEASVLAAVSTGMSLTVDTEAETVDGWVAVSYKGDTAYVSAEYVTVELALGEAITIEEERAAQAKAAEQAAAAAAAQVSSPGTVQNAPVAASVDDVTLLAALIQCEAGNEPYEGQLAVGAVVMNRVRSGAYPGSVYGVIYQPSQFGPAGRGSVASVAANGPKASCIQAAQEAINGADNTGGATCFRNASCGHAGVVIGHHVFW